MYFFVMSHPNHDHIILYFSALQSTRGSHGDYLNSLIVKLIYQTDAKKVCKIESGLYMIVISIIIVVHFLQAKQVLDLFQQN